MHSDPEESASNDTADAVGISRLPLKALGLRVGMALQTRRLVEGATKKESQFFGAIEGKGVMVGPLGPDGMKTELEAGDVCVVRGFTGQYEFSFLSKVLQTFEKPFAYALLAYPAQVDARLVRQSMRTKTSWPTTALIPATASAPQSAPFDVSLVDISISGAMIKTPTPISAIGANITICMKVDFDNTPIELVISGRVCHCNKGVTDTSFYIGLAFGGLSQHDKLVLHFVTQSAQT